MIIFGFIQGNKVNGHVTVFSKCEAQRHDRCVQEKKEDFSGLYAFVFRNAYLYTVARV